MPRDLNDFYADVGADLGITGPDRALSAEDLAIIEDAYPPLFAMLEERGLTNWLQGDDIPDLAVLPMRWIMAFHVAHLFGITGPRYDRLRDLGMVEAPMPGLGERLLRKQAAPDYIPTPQTTDYF